ncbi:portal protein [Acinetobacter sp. ANC 4558]|uniref:DUF935 domain-containing protein n=1 Tax=Acinetobacter sp. ANC 4558 TaxID=1977876 RepID=UPI000A347140|nr:DUF935 domain-containing protein [Acinetobacter sp. ANC 4558]OTG87691.1 portal protein [Acinetobacter sp. ANC 4558]
MAKKDKSQKQALETTQTADVAWLTNQWQEHPVIGLTPARLHQLLIGAEQGNLQAQADLFADMEERDGHIFSEMDKRKKSVNSLDWGINPPKNASDQEKKIAEEVKEWIDEIQDFEMFLFDAMDAVGHGYSCQEIKWQRYGSLWLPTSFQHQLARNFMTPVSQPNELRLNTGLLDGAELWDFGWFVHYHKAKSGYISRSGLHRVLTWPFLFKNYGVRDVMEFLEIYGLPIRIGQYPEGATNDEKMTLLRAVMSIGRNAGGIIPKGMSIEFENAANGDTDNHMAVIKWCEQTQSKIIVGGTLLSQADGKTSTNAQSKTHENQFEVIAKSDAKQLARSINDSLVTHLMRLNYPDISSDRYPKFYFDLTETEDLKAFSESISALVDNGMKIPLRWAHERTGIPLPTDDQDEILQKQVVQSSQTIPHLAANTFSPQLLTQKLAANNRNIPLEDQAIQLLLNEQIESSQAISEQWMSGLINKIQTGKEEDVLLLLSELNPNDDEPALQEKLTQLIFACEVFGRLSIEAEVE